MSFLSWIKRDIRPSEKAIPERQEQSPENVRFKQPGDPLKRGDRVVVYEPFHAGRAAKRPPYGPGIVESVYHNGTLVSYERLGGSPRNAPIEDVRHATEFDAHKYAKEFAAIETKIARKERSAGLER
jgi:hypothetical protein